MGIKTGWSGAVKPGSQSWLRPLASLILCSAIVSGGSPALASPETLKRSVSNLTQAPLDLLFSPMNGLLAVITQMNEQEDPVAVRVVFAVPGVIWNTGVNIGASVIRFITGGIEFVPGVFLFPFDADLDSLYSPVENAAALVEFDTPCCIYVKFGLDYTAAAY
jgi:hypothetical protein